MEEKKTPENRKRTKGRVAKRTARRAAVRKAALLLTLLAVLAGWAGVMVWGVPAPIRARLDILPDGNVKNGTLRDRESQDVKEGDFWVVLNQLPTMKEGEQKCNIEYENPSANWYGAKISLYLKETGEQLGHTRLIRPGQYVETISLNRKLPAGEYPATVKLDLFEDEQNVGTMSVEITMRVTSGR